MVLLLVPCPLLQCRAVMLPKQENAKLGRKSEFCTWQNSDRGQEPPQMCIQYTSYPADGQTSCKVWLTSIERRRCSNKTKTRTPLKFAGVPQTRQPVSAVSGPSSPYCEGMWRRYYCLTSFFPIVEIHAQMQRYSPTKLWDGAKMANFCVLFASCIFSEPRAAHFGPAF